MAIASCGFIQATENFTAGSAEATARIVEGLITGMGFIGGGAILVVSKSVRGPQPQPVSGQPARSALPLDSALMISLSFYPS